jgi:hypothetical protein
MFPSANRDRHQPSTYAQDMAKTLAGVLAVSIAALLVTGCGGGGGSLSSSPTTSPETTTTTIAALTQSQIAALLPQVTELPMGWSSNGAEVVTAADINERGFCNGPNGPGRAVAFGLIQYASTEFVLSEKGARGFVRVYGFPTADAAHGFMNTSKFVSVACPAGVNYTRVTNGTNIELYEKVSLGSAAVPSSDESFTIISNITSSVRDASVERLSIDVYARVGDVVLVTYVTGITGQSFTSDTDLFTPSVESVNASAESIVKSLLPRIGIRPQLNTSTATTTTN